MLRWLPIPALLIATVGLAPAQPPRPAAPPAKTKAQAELTPAQKRATAQIFDFFRLSTHALAQRNLADVRSADDWNRLRPQLREQLFDMLGLSPRPEKTDLRATITGRVEREDFVVENLHFQSRPGLYVTANFYRPRQVDRPLPTILYLCGHGNVKIDGVSYGAKASYQHHAAWFARHGYCCLILDTLQLAEIEGLHHGTYRLGMWWWVSRGYTPAGVEAWNCLRALDYLETRPEVDRARIGVTGRSGGGAYTWWTAALDDRPACFVPVAGITDLQNHVVDHCIEGHCDCMFMNNTRGWDFATVAALAAPRPLLLGNTDKDTIFPLDGVVRVHSQLKRVYHLLNAEDKLGLLITEGPHKDTQDLQVPAFRWFHRWLKGVDAPIVRAADKPLDPKEIKVFAELPADQKNTTIQETFVPPAAPVDPVPAADWPARQAEWLAALKSRCFANWPDPAPPLETRVLGQSEAQGLRLRVLEFTSEANLRFRVYVLQAAPVAPPEELVLMPVDSAGWKTWRSVLPAAFEALLPDPAPPRDAALAQNLLASLRHKPWALAIIPPRGEGPNQWDPEPRKDLHIRRRFLLLGRTLEDGQVWDVRRALAALRTQDDLRALKPTLSGEGRMAGIAVFAALFEPEVARVLLQKPPASLRDGPTFHGVLRVLDMPQAVALLLPREVEIQDADPAAWSWTAAQSERLGTRLPALRIHPPASKNRPAP